MQDEAAAFGAALQALWSWERKNGSRSDMNEILKQHVAFDKTKRHKPSPAAAKAYEGAYQRYKDYVEAVTPAFR